MDGSAALASEFELPFSDPTPTEREYVCGGLRHHPTESNGDRPAGNERPACRMPIVARWPFRVQRSKKKTNNYAALFLLASPATLGESPQSIPVRSLPWLFN
ncbi:hypothetical protein ISCGN_015106 [Ixodes scapularis]